MAAVREKSNKIASTSSNQESKVSEVIVNKFFLEKKIDNKSDSKFDSNINSNIDFQSKNNNNNFIVILLSIFFMFINILNNNNKFINYSNF